MSCSPLWVAPVLWLLTGCATIVNDTDEKVRISSDPPGARVTVLDEDGKAVFNGRTPATVHLAKGDGWFDGEEYTFELSKEGFENGTVLVGTDLSYWYLFGNLVFGGVIGYLIVDPASGAMWNLQDDEVHATLEPLPASMVAAAKPERAAPREPEPLPVSGPVAMPPPATAALLETTSTQAARPRPPPPVVPPSSHSAVPIRDRWAVVVGISDYAYASEDGLRNLHYAKKDALDVYETLLSSGWDRDHVFLLVDEQARSRDLRYALEDWMSKASEDDLILLYWSGHGYPDPSNPERVYLACHDSEPLRRPSSGYRMDHVRAALEEHRARNVIVLADTCHAGKLSTRGGERDLANVMGETIVAEGTVFMGAAAVDRLAIEHSSWSNGAFTHVLLSGLGGAADGYQAVGLRDGIVTLGELRAYMYSRMPQESQRVLGQALLPTVTSSTADTSIWNLPISPGLPRP